MQPAQKGGILGMWSNADELTRVNGESWMTVHDGDTELCPSESP